MKSAMTEMEKYRQEYLTLQMAIGQTRLISLSSSETLKDYPHNLPPLLRLQISETFADVQKQLASLRQTNQEAKTSMKAPEEEATDDRRPTSALMMLDLPLESMHPALAIFMGHTFSEKKGRPLDFNSLLNAQEFVMMFAHLDGFMTSSLRAICLQDERLLRREKKMSWKEILDCGNWESVIQSMIEGFCYEFGWKTIPEKLEYLQKEHGLVVELPEGIVETLGEAEKLRHIIVHNGSRISQEYLTKTKRTDLRIGDVIPVPSAYAQEISHNLLYFSAEICRAIGIKFFHASEEDLAGIPQRGR